MQIMRLSGMPSAGALLGTNSAADIISSINRNINKGHEFFGSIDDIFSKSRQVIINNIIEPIRQTGMTLRNSAIKLAKQDVIIPIVKVKDFNYVPPCMHLPILMFDPVRELHEQGRIDGFGYDPDFLPDEDVFGRLIANGTVTVDDISEYRTKEGTIEVETVYTYDSDDPDLTYQELEHIDATREAILKMLEDTDYDPTNYPCTRN